MNTGVMLLNPVSNCTRIRNCIEDYVMGLHPFNLQIGWFMGSIDYRYPDKPEDGSAGFIAFECSGKDRVKLKTARYLTRKCRLNDGAALNDVQIRELAEKINNLLWTAEELNSVELICGQAIIDAYSEEVGGSSCMTGSHAEYTGLYAANPTKFQMLIARNVNDSARAIVHVLDNGQKLLGLIYTTAEHLIDIMKIYAKNNGWLTIYDSIDDKDILVMSGLSFTDGEIPYMDALTQGMLEDNLLTISYNGGDFSLQEQNGYFNGYSCYECSDYINEDDMYGDENGNTYCEYCFSENFIHCEECSAVVHNSDSVYIEDAEIYVCQNCASSHYHCCETCGEYRTLDDMQIFNDNIYCEDCFDEIVDYCEDCNEVFCTEDLTAVGDSGPLCEDCATAVQEYKGVIL